MAHETTQPTLDDLMAAERQAYEEYREARKARAASRSGDANYEEVREAMAAAFIKWDQACDAITAEKKAARTRVPKVGDGATIQMYSDRHACTVVQVSKSGHRVIIQQDHARRTDQNGMSEVQEYDFAEDKEGKLWTCTRKDDGRYQIAGGNTGMVYFGYRSEYRDFSR